MGKKRKQLSHEEVWDDSALIDSWDAALQEYQLYHSIHARGERVEDVVKEAEATEDSTRTKDDLTVDPVGDPAEDLEDGEVEDGPMEDDAPVVTGEEVPVNETAARHQQDSSASIPADSLPIPSGSTAVPEVLIKGSTYTPQCILNGKSSPTVSAVQNDALKNLMMSWYYAGYYTGLHEGQQQAVAAVSATKVQNGE
ncbi:MAG: hypothetical protein Q9183_003904, partial [Haloplaca sp. 2 TL-2023]